MPKRPMDLEKIRQADATAQRLLEERPALREPNPARQEALADWLTEEKYKVQQSNLGRPRVYHSDKERPVQISMKIPAALHMKLQRYARRYRLSLTELVREGLEWRLSQEDPRRELTTLFDDDAPGAQETLEQMINERVQAALEAQRSARPAPVEAPATPTVADISYDSNTVIQATAPQTLEEGSPFHAPAYDPAKYMLGSLCPSGHDFDGHGHSLKLKRRDGTPGACVTCRDLRKKPASLRPATAQQKVPASA